MGPIARCGKRLRDLVVIKGGVADMGVQRKE